MTDTKLPKLPKLPKPSGSLNWTPTAENALMPGYTDNQMNAHYLKGYEDARAALAQGGKP